VNQRAHARGDWLTIARRGLELPVLDRVDRRVIVVGANAIVDVRIEHRTVGCDRDDHDHVDVAVGSYVRRPFGRGLLAHVWRYDRVGGLRNAANHQQ
jgi:hypothetical protein